MPPDFLAYQAMALCQLGEDQEARATLMLVRRHYESNSKLDYGQFLCGGSEVRSSPARVHEAEALILGLAGELPESVFAP